jgi:hypothetical protein
MSSMSDSTWPPFPQILSWRPSAGAPEDSLSSSVLSDVEDGLPAWVAVPDEVQADEYGELEVPAYALAHVETDAGRPGGGGISSIYAVPTNDGGLRIVITNDDDIPYSSPVERLEALPTVAELLRILDETEVEGEPFGVGHPTRENSDTEHREELRGFVTIRSALYPVIEQLDQSRLDQWIAERP